MGGGGALAGLSPFPDLDSSLSEVGFHTNGENSAASATSDARHALYERFRSRIHVSPVLTRKLVSYQGNRTAPGFRWLKYKEGFSSQLVDLLLDQVQPHRVLDPFSGAGTAVLTASGRGLQSTGIEIMPVGNLAGRAIDAVSNHLSTANIQSAAADMLQAVSRTCNPDAFRFPHLPITRHAFPEPTEAALARARRFLHCVDDHYLSTLLTSACLSVLEEISYTRKDGQFLRWDPQSGRDVAHRLHKASIPTLEDALHRRLDEILEDTPTLKRRYGGSSPTFVDGSSLTFLKTLPANSFDAVITSPPYANRYDYTRTYALELAFLDYDKEAVSQLRQDLLTATVENKSKRHMLAEVYGPDHLYSDAVTMADGQEALQEVLAALRANARSLSNPNVISLVEHYFTEMAVIVLELARLVTTGGNVFMVADNVRYHGEEAPVDLILSDFAEQAGFRCEAIWTLNRGKGNSSQQMGRFGRQELRKCIYHWVKADG